MQYFIGNRQLIILTFLLAVTIFLVDLFVDPAFDVGVLYVAVVLMTIWIRGKTVTLASAYIVTVLAIISIIPVMMLLPIPKIPVINRIISLIGIWAAAWMVIKVKLSSKNRFKNQERLDALFEHATEGFLIMNDSGEIIMANPAAAKQFGYQMDEMIGLKAEALVPELFQMNHLNSIHVNPYQPEFRNAGVGLYFYAKRKDQFEFPVEISLSSFYTDEGIFRIAFIVDITERKKDEEEIAKNVDEIQKLNSQLETIVEERTAELAEAIRNLECTNKNLQENIREKIQTELALKESQMLYSVMAHNFPSGIITVIDKAHHIVFIDGKDIGILEYSSQALVGRPFLPAIQAEANTELKKNLDAVFAGGQAGLEISVGKGVYYLNAVPLSDSKDQIMQALVVMLNITKRKKAEEEIRNALEKEKVLNELKSRFVSMASHEFRTPLSAILSSVSLIGKYLREEEQDKRDKHIQRIQSSVKVMNDILNDILSLGKLEEGKVEPKPSFFELQPMLAEMTDSLQQVLKPGQSLKLNFSCDTPAIVTDKNLLRNIFTNLISNAVKYSPEHSVIELNISNDEAEFIMEVKDYGVGIPDEDQSHLFERFFRANNVSNIQGTGLGLNIVRKYVQLMKGSINFKSKVNVGSSFYIYLPKNSST